jgi:hypothetical protein
MVQSYLLPLKCRPIGNWASYFVGLFHNGHKCCAALAMAYATTVIKVTAMAIELATTSMMILGNYVAIVSVRSDMNIASVISLEIVIAIYRARENLDLATL